MRRRLIDMYDAVMAVTHDVFGVRAECSLARQLVSSFRFRRFEPRRRTMMQALRSARRQHNDQLEHCQGSVQMDTSRQSHLPKSPL